MTSHLLPNTFQLRRGATTTITLPGLDPAGPYSLTTSGFAGNVSDIYDCADSTCHFITLSSTPIVGQSITLTPVVTTSRPIHYDWYEIYGSGLNIYHDALGGPNSYTVSFPEPGDYRIIYAMVTDREDYCSMSLAVKVIPPPVFTISASGSCSPTGPIFTITNNGPDDMIAPETFTITDAGGNDVTPAPGNFQLNAGDSTTISLTGLNPYVAYTLSYTGSGGTSSAAVDCGNPSLVVSTDCSDTPAFTIYNNVTGDMLVPQTFTITDAAGNDITPLPQHLPTSSRG